MRRNLTVLEYIYSDFRLNLLQAEDAVGRAAGGKGSGTSCAAGASVLRCTAAPVLGGGRCRSGLRQGNQDALLDQQLIGAGNVGLVDHSADLRLAGLHPVFGQAVQ